MKEFVPEPTELAREPIALAITSSEPSAVWRDLLSLPRDETVLITVEPTEKHPYLYGSPRWPRTYCAYVNEDGRLCDSGTFAPELGFQGPNFRTVAWMPLPPPMIHASDCALHNAPALPVGPCDCGAIATGAGQ